MAIRSKSLDDMIGDIIVSLGAGEPKQPSFTLLVGSGFSYPIIPTPTQMLRGDIAWWRYSKDQKFTDPFCSRAEGVAGKKATEEQIAEFEREMWKPIHARALTSKETAFGLTADGLPDLNTPNAVGLAYQAVMADGLLNNKMRRQYLRDAIQRSHPKVNGAHIFLAGILEAQETWDWGAPFCRTIFTTNFDPLLQRSLQLVNKLYYMTDRPDVLEPPDDDQSEAIHLVYTHGSVHRYDLLNTEDEIKHAREKNAPTLIDYFRRHGVIVMGYSGWADTTMDALSSCASFDSNLYWCDIHSAADAQTRLRPEVLEVLEAQEKHAFYVPIPGADEAMRQLHRELKLGDVPKFILAPVETMIAQLESIEVPSEPTPSENQEALSTSLKALLKGNLTRLNVAKSAFDDPSIVQSGSSRGQEEVAKALVAQLLSDALVAYWGGERDLAITLWSTVITTPVVPAKDRAIALYSRGVTSGENGETTKAIADYTAVIDMPDAPADRKALAHYNRAIAWGNSGEITKEIADYTSIIDMPDVPSEQNAKALINRGVTWGQRGETTKEIADYTAVVDMPHAPTDQKALALCNRGIAWGKIGETMKEVADYTAVIDMPDAPADRKATALNNRGIVRGKSGETMNEVADYTAVIDMPDAPADQKAIALYNRGNAWGQNGETTKAIADYTSVIDMPDAPAEQKAKALHVRGIAWGKNGETMKAISDYTTVIDMPDAPTEQKAKAFWNRGWRRFVDLDDAQSMINDSQEALKLANDNLSVRANLALGLLITGETDTALSQYEALLSRSSDTSAIREAIGDLETALQKRPDTPEAAKVLDRLRSAMTAKNDSAAAAPS